MQHAGPCVRCAVVMVAGGAEVTGAGSDKPSCERRRNHDRQRAPQTGAATAWPSNKARTARTNNPARTCLALAAKSAAMLLPRHAPDCRHEFLNLVPLLDHIA